METKYWTFFALLMTPALAIAQSINISRDVFPGYHKIVVTSPGRGYRGEYVLDKNGRAEIEDRYKKSKHLATDKYWFTEKGQLKVHKVTYDINNPTRIQTFYNKHFYSSDSTKILREVCLSDSDTLYTINYTAFNERNFPTRYTKFTYARKVFASDVELTYLNTRIAKWISVDREDNQITSCKYDYNDKGDVVSESRSLNPASAGENLWIDGQGDLLEWKYEYNKEGYWTRKIKLVKGKYVLSETRKYIKGS